MRATAVPLNSYPLATCLDGSSGRYYLRPGAETRKFFIFHEGGGFCGSEDDCAQRANTSLGSTVDDSPTMALTDSYFSRDEELSPLLWNWTHVYVRYCDGAYYSGERSEQLKSGLYYRGRWVTEAVVTDLNARHGLEAATDVVFGGCSAGAIRTYAHLDALRALVPATARVAGFPDSGFYMDVDKFTSLKHYVVASDGHAATSMLGAACRAAHPSQLEKCLVASAAARFVATPICAWQSEHDVDQRGCEMNQTCAESAACVNEYGANLTSALRSQLLAAGRNGAFLDSCSRHCSYGAKHPLKMAVDGVGPLQALATWYRGGRREWVQGQPYPCTECCG
jgi:hypothetical protein